MAAQSIEIPIHNSEEVLEVSLDDLAENPSFILDILNQEHAPVKIFLEFAFRYHERNMFAEFNRFMKEGSAVGQNSTGQERDYLILLSTLASSHVRKALSCVGQQSKEEKAKHLDAATELFNLADRIDSHSVVTWMGKGLYYFARGNLEQSAVAFRYVLERIPRSVEALLGKALILSQKLDYSGALSCYQKALQFNPGGKLDVRFGIGLCYLKLDLPDLARKAFARTLERNPSSVDALIMLSILDTNAARALPGTSPERASLLSRASTHLMKAFKLQKNHPLVALQMGFKFFARGEHDKTNAFCDLVSRNTDSVSLLADAYNLKGRSAQSQADYNGAYELFQKAVALQPQNALFQYGMGQMHAFKGEVMKAIECYEKVIQSEPNSYEALKHLASLHALQDPNGGKAMEYFSRIKKLLKSYKDESKFGGASEVFDPEIAIEMGQVTESSDLSAAKHFYSKAVTIMKSAKEERIPGELYNNIAVLSHVQGDFEHALQMYSEAKKAMEANEDTEGEENLVATLYNMARLHESKDAIDEAQALYNDILQRCPGYLDCHLRLAVIEVGQGKLDEAGNRLADVLASNPKYLEAYILLGRVQHLQKAHKLALKTFEKANEISKPARDTFTLCAWGNLYMELGRSNPKDRATFFRYSFENFAKALRADNRCIHAANGLAICLAEQGRLAEAKEVFSQLDELSGEAPFATLNLAHTLIEMEQLKQGITLYESILQRPDQSQEPYIYLCLSRAYFILAKQEKSPSTMMMALSLIQKAAHLRPRDLGYLYNMALIKQQYAQIMNEQNLSNRPLALHKKALYGLDAASRIFHGLANLTNAHGYDVKHAKERAAYCKDVKRQTEKKIHETEVLEKQREERRQAIADERLLKEQEQERLKLLKEAERRSREEEIENNRRELLLKMQEDLERTKQLEEEAKKTKRQTKLDEYQNEEEGDNLDGDSSSRKRSRRPKERKRKRTLQSGSVESEDEPSEEEGSEGETKRRRLKGVQSTLSKAIIDSSDEEDDDQPLPTAGDAEEDTASP